MKSTIVFLHPHFLKYGGASKVVLEQASGLKKKGFDIKIITTTINQKIVSDYPNLQIVTLSKLPTGSLFFWLTFPIFYIKLVNQLNSIHDKIVYCHSLATYWGYFYKLCYPKTKLTIYFHDLGFPYFDSTAEYNSLPLFPRTLLYALSPLFKHVHGQIIKISDHLIANSQTTFNCLKNLYARRPDTIIYPGIDLKLFHQHSDKLDYFITVGRLEKIKNITTIIKGYSLYIKNTNIRTNLLIVGEGPEKTHIQKLSKQLNITKRVKLLGTRSPVELSKLYGQAKLGIFMSPFESFGLTAVECLSCGTPIIGVDQNGIGEITKNCLPDNLVGNNPLVLSQKIKQTAKALTIVPALDRYGIDAQIASLGKFFSSIS